MLVPPRVPYETCQDADLVGSTEFIIEQVENAPPGTQWAIGTEINLVAPAFARAPRAARPVAAEERVPVRHHEPHRSRAPVWALENLVAGHVVNEIVVDDRTIEWAKVALGRMLEIR